MSSEGFLSITKQVIRKAAEIGLDEAGTRICGSAWPYAKKVMSPIFDELQRRFPKLLLVGDEDAKAASEQAADALSRDPELQKLLDDGFSGLRQGQTEILQMLARNNDMLQLIASSVDAGLAKAQQEQTNAYQQVMAKMAEIQVDIQVLLERGKPVEELPVSAAELFTEANNYQIDAIHWLTAGDANAASERLRQGRELARTGLQREPENLQLMLILGYIEKTQAQVNLQIGNHENAIRSLAEAAKYFKVALEHDPEDVSALNGMGNVYALSGDFDHAIELGRLVYGRRPDYAAAVSDLTNYLENKLYRDGPDVKLQEELVEVYATLEKLIPENPGVFPASDVLYVQRRLNELKNRGRSATGDK